MRTRLLPVLRKLFFILNLKNAVRTVPFGNERTEVWNRRLSCVRFMSLHSSLNRQVLRLPDLMQSVICIVESSKFFRGVGEVLLVSAHLWMTQVFTFLLKQQVLEHSSENLNVIPSLKELCQYKPHKHISTATPQKQKKLLYSPKHLHLLFAVLYKTGTPL